MAEYINQRLKVATIELDGAVFVGCTFEDCTLIYRGGALPRLERCGFKGAPRIQFTDAAERTLHFLEQSYAGGLRPVIDATIANLVSGKHLPPR